MNMPMPMPLPLQFSQSRRICVPSVLRRALLCCVAAFIGALLLWFLSSVRRIEVETERNNARANAQKAAKQLSDAHEGRLASVARAKRFALVKTVLESSLPEKTEREQLSEQLSAHPHIVEPILTIQPGQPAFSAGENSITLQHIHIETGLLHEEALLALNTIVTSFPAHIIPTSCSLQRETDAAPITLRAHCEYDWITLTTSSGGMQ